MRQLDVVVGAQYGSEAKGHVTAFLANEAVHNGRELAVVRVAGPNAGHTACADDGTPVAFRQVPCAAVVPGPMTLVIANGSEIDPGVLLDELDFSYDAGHLEQKKVWVAGEATIVTEENQRDEQFASHHDLVAKIGSTGKGVGAARADRIMRKAQRVIDSPWLLEQLHDRKVEVVPPNSGQMIEQIEHVIIEGTQGYGLGLHQGHYPQCTSSDCRAIDFLSMAGINPWVTVDNGFPYMLPAVNVWAVARMFPIRVAGNSGPLANETSWAELGLPDEYTTVTKKVRRVGRPDWGLVRDAVAANGGTPIVKVALTMVDQQWPDTAELEIGYKLAYDSEIGEAVLDIERQVGTQVRLIGTGPDTMSRVEWA